MANCLDDKKWKSKVPKNASKESAEFKISRDLGNGDFEGKFKVDGGSTEDIKGNCSAATIWFLRPAESPLYLYSGHFIYVGDDRKFIDGTKESRSEILADGKRPRNKPLGDEWTAEKAT